MKGRRLVFTKEFHVELEEFTIDDIQDHQILVKTSASLISPGTELSIYTGTHSGFKDPKHTWVKFPFYPGYAAAGEVISCGKNVTEVSVGDRIFFHGSHSNYSILESNAPDIIKLPDNITFQHAPIIRLGAIAMTSVAVSHFKSGDSVAVLGLGLIGQLALQLFRINGAARMIGIDVINKRLEISRRCGATDTINPKDVNLEDKVNELTGRRGVNTVIEATGNPDAIKDALKIAGERGEIIILGSPRGVVNDLDLYTQLHCKGLSIIGAHACILPVTSDEPSWSITKCESLVVSYIEENELVVDELISHIVSPKEAQMAYQGLLESKNKFCGVILDWNKYGG